MVERFEADVWVTRGGETVGGTSIMGLMMLSASPGTTILVSAKGPEAQAALDAIAALVAKSSTKKACERLHRHSGMVRKRPDPESRDARSCNASIRVRRLRVAPE